MTSTIAELLTPQALPFAWSWEPLVMVPIAATFGIYLYGLHRLWKRGGRGRVVSSAQAACFFVGLTFVFLALESPLDALSDYLLSAHMAQHVILMFVAAPLLMAGRPGIIATWALPLEDRRHVSQALRKLRLLVLWRFINKPAVSWVLITGLLFVWHLPGLYQLAVENAAVHAAEHVTFLAIAMLFWHAVLRAGEPRQLSSGAALLYVVVTALSSSLLGILMTLSQVEWYSIYASTSPAWHLSPSNDQQLAGLFMWLPPSGLYLAFACRLFLRWLNEVESRVDSRSGIVSKRPNAVAEAIAAVEGTLLPPRIGLVGGDLEPQFPSLTKGQTVEAGRPA